MTLSVAYLRNLIRNKEGYYNIYHNNYEKKAGHHELVSREGQLTE